MQQVWPLLAITASVHRALYAWILFRQAVLSGDGSLLEGDPHTHWSVHTTHTSACACQNAELAVGHACTT